MKSKKLTGGLLIVVVVVWAMIFLKIFNAIGSSNKGVQNNITVDQKKDTTYTMNDTFSIINNYRDPFLGVMVAEHHSNESELKKGKTIKKVTALSQNVKWPSIIYSGIIKRKESTQPMAIVKIDGHSDFMMRGSISSGVELQSLYNDSIMVVFNGERKVIKK